MGLLKIKKPKITIGKKLDQGVSKAVSKTVELSLTPITVPATEGLKAVSQLAKQPGAGIALGAAGSYFGVPGLGNLIPPQAPNATAYVERKADFDMPQTQDFVQPKNNNIYYYIAGAVVLIGGLFLVLKRK